MLVVNGNINLILLKLFCKEKLVAKENSRIFYRTSQIFETLQRKKTQKLDIEVGNLSLNFRVGA
jgi:hypothetical protein